LQPSLRGEISPFLDSSKLTSSRIALQTRDHASQDNATAQWMI
jgi:hypothetical protein